MGGKYWNKSSPNTIQRYFGDDVNEKWKNLYNNVSFCDMTTHSFELRRKCKLMNATAVQWELPHIFCRSQYFDANHLHLTQHSNHRCDAAHSSLIYGLAINDTSQCLSYCANLQNCIAFEYATSGLLNESVPFCLFYADCALIEVINDITVYIAPFSKSASIENYCFGAYSVDGHPSAQCFNASLFSYFTDRQGIINSDKVIFNDQSLLYSANGYTSLSVISSYNSFVVNNIDDDDLAVAFLLKLRA